MASSPVETDFTPPIQCLNTAVHPKAQGNLKSLSQDDKGFLDVIIIQLSPSCSLLKPAEQEQIQTTRVLNHLFRSAVDLASPLTSVLNCTQRKK